MSKHLKIADEVIINKIYFIRGHKIMLDKDLAEMYGVSTGNLNKAVKRNIKRFPVNFLFQLTREEYDSLRFQFGILEKGKHSKYLPYVFTEHGTMMVANVLKSKRAVQMSVRIIEIFIKMRELLSTHKDVLLNLEQLEKHIINHNHDIRYIFDVLKKLVTPITKTITKPRKRVGYKRPNEK